MDQLHFNSVYSGERFVLVTADDDTSLGPHDTSSSRRPANLAAKHSSTEERIASQLVSESVLENLINLYRMRIIPVNPIVSISETVGLFPWIRKPHLDSIPPTPLPRLLRLIVCSVPAQWRAVPKEIRESLHVTLQSQMDGGGGSALMRTSSLGNVQTLLVLAISLEVLRTRRESWLTVGLAIRMAQEIGLHREMPDYAVPIGQRNRRKRVWAACQITDAWYALTSGLPLTINPGDCDVGSPSPFPDHALPGQEDEDRCFETHIHLWQLSLILGRTMRAVCDSGGLAFTSDAVLYQIERDLVDRELEFPSEEELPAFGEFDRGNTNILKLVSVCIEGILHRAFLQPARPIPAHITFRPSTARWIRLVRRSAEAIHWLSKKEGIFYLDVWHIVVYSLVVCTIIQTHDYLTSGNTSTRESLQLANKVVQSWAKSSDGEHPRKRAKIASQLGALISAVVASRPQNTENPRPSTSSSSSGLSVSPTATALFTSQQQLRPELYVQQQQQPQQRQQHQQQQQEQQLQQPEPSDVNFRTFSFDSEMGPLVEGSIWDLLNSDAPSVFPTEHAA
ncbi:fungal-specific transcription factor domain-domain-containing protein [Naematelia encephala]|uniref:Fungal-specific transcription factor domain-domain-containing protein n=1 Tax=Naematelia encephala TaxID=71784 RepID=A0A1Y2B017_9TREE|nr:fungal-specific transcription factor domain-domain-containing protein [Naematelia encephala]